MNTLEFKKYNLDKIYKEALGFRKTYDILNENAINIFNINEIDYLTPMITSIIFSCELYLKLLLVYLKIDFKREHSLDALFKLLPEELQTEIKNIFNEKCSDESYFEKTLKSTSNSYTIFRYYFSYSDNITIHLTFFENFNNILLEKAINIF